MYKICPKEWVLLISFEIKLLVSNKSGLYFQPPMTIINSTKIIVLTFRQREGVKKQSYLKQISRERSEGVELLEVSSNKGVKIDD